MSVELKKIENHIYELALNNSDQKNAITYKMIDDLESHLKVLSNNSDCRVVILTGIGSAFCAGGDVKAMKDQTGMFQGDSHQLRDLYQQGIQRIPKCIESFQKPILALVNGPAVGAGCDLSMMCDLRIGSDLSSFAETFNRLGLVPGDGGTFFLQRVLGYSKAMNMFLTCKSYKGQEAHQYGLLDYYFNSENVYEETLKIARSICESAPISVRLTKTAMKLSYLSTMEQSLELLSTYQGITQRTKDHFEAVDALLNKRKPEFHDQ